MFLRDSSRAKPAIFREALQLHIKLMFPLCRKIRLINRLISVRFIDCFYHIKTPELSEINDSEPHCSFDLLSVIKPMKDTVTVFVVNTLGIMIKPDEPTVPDFTVTRVIRIEGVLRAAHACTGFGNLCQLLRVTVAGLTQFIREEEIFHVFERLLILKSLDRNAIEILAFVSLVCLPRELDRQCRKRSCRRGRRRPPVTAGVAVGVEVAATMPPVGVSLPLSCPPLQPVSKAKHNKTLSRKMKTFPPTALCRFPLHLNSTFTISPKLLLYLTAASYCCFFSRSALFLRRCSLLLASDAKISTAASVRSSPQVLPETIAVDHGQIFS